MLDIVAYSLQILMIIIAISIVLHKRNFTIIILFATFSLVAAGLYFINSAPDVAIAEVAIGTAIIPLIYVISISRQREFIVLDKVRQGFVDPDEKLTGEVYDILNQFVESYDLRLNVCCDLKGKERDLTSQLNVDLIISVDPKTNHYVLKGKSSNLLMSKLKKIVKDNPNIRVEVFKEGESID